MNDSYQQLKLKYSGENSLEKLHSIIGLQENEIKNLKYKYYL